jgi:membrane protease subunit HflC
MNRKVGLLVLIIVLLGFVSMSAFTVAEHELAVKFKLGKIVKNDYEPGLHFQIPIINNVRKFDRRLMSLDAESARFLTSENKYVIVDAFAKWRIVDPGLFYMNVGGDEAQANIRLMQIIQRGLRDQFGERTIQDVISGERLQVMRIVNENADRAARELGITVKDVRIKRIDLPDEVSESVYARMRAEREKVARELRAEGREESERIRADADRQRTVLVAEAYRDSQKIRGEGDAVAAETYANAYGQGPEFFKFYKSLSAYQQVFSEGQNLIVMEPDSEFFDYFKNSVSAPSSR